MRRCLAQQAERYVGKQGGGEDGCGNLHANGKNARPREQRSSRELCPEMACGGGQVIEAAGQGAQSGNGATI